MLFGFLTTPRERQGKLCHPWLRSHSKSWSWSSVEASCRHRLSPSSPRLPGTPARMWLWKCSFPPPFKLANFHPSDIYAFNMQNISSILNWQLMYFVSAQTLTEYCEISNIRLDLTESPHAVPSGEITGLCRHRASAVPSITAASTEAASCLWSLGTPCAAETPRH